MKRVTAVVVAYGASPLLGRCVEALLASVGVDVEVVVVDNGTTDGSVAALPPHPKLRCMAAPRNLGFGGGCNLGATVAGGDVLAFVNPDAIADRGALAALATALDDPTIGIVTAQIRLLREPGLINSAGGAIHFLGLGWAIGYRDPAERWNERREVAAASGAGMAMRAETFEALGGFTEELFLYHEDAELSWRAWMAGLRLVYIPEARIDHDYEFSRHPEKLYYLERNRLVFVLTCYQRETLARLTPLLLGFELVITIVAGARGWLPAKMRGWLWLMRNRHWLLARRRSVQANRVRGDGAIAVLLAARFDPAQAPLPALLGVLDRGLAGVWRKFVFGARTEASKVVP